MRRKPDWERQDEVGWVAANSLVGEGHTRRVLTTTSAHALSLPSPLPPCSLFELAILGMLKEGLTTDGLTGALVMDPVQRGQRKAIYVAPMRSLVQEKAAVRVVSH